MKRPLIISLYAFILGIAHTIGFAPIPYGGWIELIVMSCFYALLYKSNVLTKSIYNAILIGVFFGFGNFISGIHWIYISAHNFGGINTPFAVIILFLFSFYLSCYSGLASVTWTWLTQFRNSHNKSSVNWSLIHPITFAACWSTSEWLRGTAFTGFPWLSVGYSHVDTILSAFARWLGVYGVSFTATLSSSTLASIFLDIHNNNFVKEFSLKNDKHFEKKEIKIRFSGLAFFLLIIFIAILSRLPHFVYPCGSRISVRLLQGNINQNLKFRETAIMQAIDLYEHLLITEPADLIVTPETAYAVPLIHIPKNKILTLQTFAKKNSSNILFGAIGMNLDKRKKKISYTNSMFGINTFGDFIYRCDKHHLVPFGEFVPYGFQWLVNRIRIPFGELDQGSCNRSLFYIKRQQPIAVFICYEDIFGEEVAQVLRHGENSAGLLISTANFAWFGNTIALDQHLQIIRMRALESGRPVAHATNTGLTVAIDAQGHILSKLPVFKTGTLNILMQTMQGLTPYVRFGNLSILAICSIIIFISLAKQRKII